MRGPRRSAGRRTGGHRGRRAVQRPGAAARGGGAHAVLGGVIAEAAWWVGVSPAGAGSSVSAGEAVVFVLAALGPYAGKMVVAATRVSGSTRSST